MTPFFSYLVFLSLCCAAGLIAGWWEGRRFVIGASLCAALVAASWFGWSAGGSPINVHTSVAVLSLVAFCVHSGRSIRTPLVALDLLMMGLVVWNVICDSVHDGFRMHLIGLSYGEWALPYVAGRFAVMHSAAISKLSPWFALTGCFIAAAAIFESVTGINVWEVVFVQVDDLVQSNRAKRYGLLHRALGPTRHPIFLSIVLMLIMPWSVGWVESASSRAGRFLGVGTLISLIVGVGATVSRGPALALCVGAVFYASVMNRVIRWSSVVLLVLVGIVGYARWDNLLSILEIGSETRRAVVEYEGEQVVYSGTRNRMFVVQIYAPLVLESGVVGYGTNATASFPPNIPGLPTDPSSRNRLGIVDNAYLLVGLRLGVVGVGLFTALIIAAIVCCVRLRSAAGTILLPAGHHFMTALAATLVAVAIEIGTVFWSYDYAFWLLMVIGVVAGIDSRGKQVLSGR